MLEAVYVCTMIYVVLYKLTWFNIESRLNESNSEEA